MTRRPLVFIVAASIVFAAVLAVVLVLAQRMYADPWRAGATSVGRMSVDPSLTAPGVFSGTELHSHAKAYQNFHGLGAVVYTQTINGSTNSCMVIYRLSDLTTSLQSDPSGNSFTGLYSHGCAAGTFPAVVQLDLHDDVPAELRTALPKRAAVQFVYDGKNHEIHVFAE